jgi:chloramphenicol 3-O-phosphotransferase
VIVLLNGAFGIGKTTVAREVVKRALGIPLQHAARVLGRAAPDFQDLPAWRSLTVQGLRVARLGWRVIVVPMAISNANYLAELRSGISQFEPRLLHFCLMAPVEVVHDRLRARGANPVEQSWQFRRAAECCAVHGRDVFATHVDAARSSPQQLATELLARMGPGEPGR